MRPKRSPKEYLTIMLKGVAMGASDVVPGVSGGTIALITGVYEELIETIKQFDAKALKLFFSGKFKSFWEKINGTFLFSLLAGILLSIIALAGIISDLLITHPILIWSFFFGLVLSSTYFVAKRVTHWGVQTFVAFIIGAIAAFFITMATPAETPTTWWFIFLSGAIAICAMILPGISGSFILVLLGKYAYIIDAIRNLKITTLLLFAMGAAVGIISFSNLLSWLLKRYHNITIAILSGFMLGSLNKIWPWKEQIITTLSNSTTFEVERNILPKGSFLLEIGLILFGVLLVWGLETLSKKYKK